MGLGRYVKKARKTVKGAVSKVRTGGLRLPARLLKKTVVKPVSKASTAVKKVAKKTVVKPVSKASTAVKKVAKKPVRLLKAANPITMIAAVAPKKLQDKVNVLTPAGVPLIKDKKLKKAAMIGYGGAAIIATGGALAASTGIKAGIATVGATAKAAGTAAAAGIAKKITAKAPAPVAPPVQAIQPQPAAKKGALPVAAAIGGAMLLLL